MKKFIIPNILTLLVLSLFWFAGVESVVSGDDSLQQNIKKYVQTQRHIVDNYVDEVDVTDLYKNSVRGLVTNLSDSTADLEDTPADTTFEEDLSISSIRESAEKFEEAYLHIDNNYPDEDMNARVEDALEHMFKGLDPHSVYIEPSLSDDIDDEFSGKFQGIGVQFNVIQDTITVITAIAGGPSDALGIRSGDRIIKIDGEDAVGYSNEDVTNSLRGPKDSEVDVTVKRPNVKDPMEFTIVRDDIPLYSIGASYMLDEETGYIKMDKFIQTTHEEFMEAMEELQDQGMERLLLDLRGNPGGYLSQAVAIAEEFFPKGTELVSTQSRHTRFTSSYLSRRDGYFKDKPLMILVDEGSASASEIVSGAVQDHDRGWIVGRRTFGKGLVQQQYELVDSSKIRVTISKYYTPSGRLIQKPYDKDGGEGYAYEIYERGVDAEGDASEFISDIPDSLQYSTNAGRTVYGGGGIVPDHIVQPDTAQSAIVANFMLRHRVGFEYVRDFLDKGGSEFREKWEEDFDRFNNEFEWPEETSDEIYSRLQDKNMVVSDTLSTPDFKSDTLYIPEGHYEEVEDMALGLMKAELARQIWGLKKYYPVRNKLDETIDAAKGMWDEVHQLKEYAAQHTSRD
ncbi:MAG: S41 family peptidase [Bacteroidota bacterium]